MLGDYVFDWKSIVELVAVVVVFTVMFAFFMHKKNVKLMLLYAAAFIFYVAIIFADIIFGFPVARALVTLLMFFMAGALIVVYQSDFKSFFFNLTKPGERGAAQESSLSDEEQRHAVDEIIRACQNMSKSRTGALIVIAPTSIAPHILETGTELGALISAPLLESIFNTRAPFHDGAVIVKGNRALAAGCFLPLSQSQSLAKSLGTRHRAGIGITEETDMLTIILSEETGIISVAQGGNLRRFITPDRLRDILHETFHIAVQKKGRSLQ